MYEIKIGSVGGMYGFDAIMPLRFETLQECKASAQVLADIVLGFGDAGSAIMIVNTGKAEGVENECDNGNRADHPDCSWDSSDDNGTGSHYGRE